MSQCEKVLNYIDKHGGITSMEAFSELGVTRLSARIWDLRHDGHNIVSVQKSGTNRFGELTNYVEYRRGLNGEVSKHTDRA